MMTRNISNLLFEEYLRSEGLSWEYEPEAAGKSKRPDYRISAGAGELRLELKEFELEYELHLGAAFEKSGGAYDPLPRIREKINQARRQFREYKNSCCALVLYNPGFPRVDIDEPLTVFGAMLGDPGIRYTVDKIQGRVVSPIQQAFLGGGRMRVDANTTISAILVLEEFLYASKRWRIEEQQRWATAGAEERTIEIAPYDPGAGSIIRVVRYESPHAKRPFPPTTFCGPADEIWRVDESGTRPVRVFAGPSADQLWSRRIRSSGTSAVEER
jgi:hypothetical protein